MSPALALLAGAALATGAGGAVSVHAARVARPPTIDGALAPGEWDAPAVFEGYSPALELNGEGFLVTQNLHRLFSRLAYRFFDLGPTRETTFGLEPFGRQTWDGRWPIARGLQLDNRTVWANSWETWVELQLFPGIYDEDREAVLNLNPVPDELLPGSVLDAVFTRGQAGAPNDFASLGSAPAEQVFLLKASAATSAMESASPSSQSSTSPGARANAWAPNRLMGRSLVPIWPRPGTGPG
jgi:hypothetical protein